MMVLDIQFNTVQDAARLSDEASKLDETLYVHSIKGLTMVDARSMLALFTLVGQPCHLVAEDTLDPKVFYNVARRAGVLL